MILCRALSYEENTLDKSLLTTPCWSITIFTAAPKGRHFSCPIPGERI